MFDRGPGMRETDMNDIRFTYEGLLLSQKQLKYQGGKEFHLLAHVGCYCKMVVKLKSLLLPNQWGGCYG